MSLDRITITAQQRALRRKIWEQISPKRVVENIFQDTLGKQMGLIRKKDDEIRKEAESLKNYLKSAKQALKDRRYLEFIQWVTEIDKVSKQIGSEVTELEALRKEHVDDFYGQADPNIVDLDQMNEYFSQSAEASQFNLLMKEAGIMDWFGSQRERAAKTLEKMYSNTLRKRHREMVKLYNKTSGFVKVLLNKLKVLDKARTGRNVSDYIAGLNEIREAHRGFNNDFRTIYNANVKDIVDRLMKDRANKTGPGAELAKEDKPGIDDRTNKPVEPDDIQRKKQEALEQERARREAELRRKEEIASKVTVPQSESLQEQEFLREQPMFGGVGLVPNSLVQQYEALRQRSVPNTPVPQSSELFAPTEVPEEASSPTLLAPDAGAPPSPRVPAEVGVMTGEPDAQWWANYWSNLKSKQVEQELDVPRQQAIGDIPSASPSRPMPLESAPAIEVSDVEEERNSVVSEHPEVSEEADIVVEEVREETTSPADAVKKLQKLRQDIKDLPEDFEVSLQKFKEAKETAPETYYKLINEVYKKATGEVVEDDAWKPAHYKKLLQDLGEWEKLEAGEPMEFGPESEPVAEPVAEPASESPPASEPGESVENIDSFFEQLMSGSSPPSSSPPAVHEGRQAQIRKLQEQERNKKREEDRAQKKEEAAKAKPKATKKRGPKKPPAKSPGEVKKEKRKGKKRAQPITIANTYFFNQLKKQAHNPVKMSRMLCKYSELIDDIDPTTSAKLLNIAEGLLLNVR